MSWETGLVLGSIGLSYIFYLLWNSAENPIFKEMFLGLFVGSPLLIIYSLIKVEEITTTIGHFFNKFIILYGVFFVVFLIIKFYLIILNVWDSIVKKKLRG